VGRAGWAVWCAQLIHVRARFSSVVVTAYYGPCRVSLALSRSALVRAAMAGWEAQFARQRRRRVLMLSAGMSGVALLRA